MTNEHHKLPVDRHVSPADFQMLVDAVARLRIAGASTTLEMHRSALGTLLSPAAGAKLELLEFSEQLEAFDTAKDAARLTFRVGEEEDEEEDKWVEAGGADRRVADAQGAAYLAGERRLCYFHPAAGRYVPVDAFQWHLGVLDEDLAAGGSATVSLWQLHDIGPSDSGLDVTACDWLLDDGQKLPAGTRVIVQLIAHSRKWIVTQASGCSVDAE
ncbi:MAG: hypothetical protein C0483_20540 [Pirellula sp.]|nr:hypothetical protein [Pirellula sp.]